MTEIRFRLDEQIYADIIAQIRVMAGESPLSKTMPRILVEWYLLKSGQNAGNVKAETWQNEDKDSLSDSLSSLSFE